MNKAVWQERLDPAAKGLRLYRHTRGGVLRACELVMFASGYAGVETTLRRAAISGTVQVEPFAGVMDYFADVYVDTHTFTQTVLLDRDSYLALKTRWMRCRAENE